MSYNDTIGNYLYDEENEYTQANDLWENFFMERQDEIDERPWIQADALVDRLTHNAYLINMNGVSYRLKETKKFNQKLLEKDGI